MPEITLTVEHQAGLHARPAALLVKTANQFASEIVIHKDDRQANAKSLLSVLTLGVSQDTEIRLSAQGEDAAEALARLSELIERNFEEAE